MYEMYTSDPPGRPSGYLSMSEYSYGKSMR
jgi:hypothetical protein